jgi:hypothetical protein
MDKDRLKPGSKNFDYYFVVSVEYSEKPVVVEVVF